MTKIKKLDSIYIEYGIKYNLNVDREYGELVNFSNHKNLPFQRWHYYQEGYSPKLVEKLVEKLNITVLNSTILDPFSGSGSTLVAAQKLGIDAIGVELNPFSYFMSVVKTTKFSAKTISNCKNFEIPQYQKIKNVYKNYELTFIEKLYTEENLSKIEILRNSIELVKEKKAKIIYKAALFSILEETSNYKKGGNGLKRRKIVKDVDVFEIYKFKLNQILEDIQSKKQTSKVKIYNRNVKDLNNIVENNTIDFTIFSPPYANCFDYFEVYKIELWLGRFVRDYKTLRKMRREALTSNLNANLNQDVEIRDLDSELFENAISLISEGALWDKRILKMLKLYFLEMKDVIENLMQKCKSGSYVAIIVGNSAYVGIPIATDLILAEISSNIGFVVKEIIVARSNETSSQQYKKIGNMVKYIRESIIILKK